MIHMGHTLSPFDAFFAHSSTSGEPTLPSYAESCITADDHGASPAERYFWLGFICPFVFWPMGFARIWAARKEETEVAEGGASTQRGNSRETAPATVNDGTGELWRWSVGTSAGDVDGETNGSAPTQGRNATSLADARAEATASRASEEERTWAKRCGVFFVGWLLVGTVFSIIIVSIVREI